MDDDVVTDPARAERRFALVYLVRVEEGLRSGRVRRSWAVGVLPRACERVGTHWTGSLDKAWVRTELVKTKAEPGEYAAESYERWRLSGLPIWAALAAGMAPTPGSRKILGRRPTLP